MAELLDHYGLEHLPGEGTFYLFVSIGASRLGSAEFCDRLLEEHGVSVVPGIGYGESCDRFIRLSVGTESMERTREGILRVNRLIEETAASPARLAATALAG